MANLIHRSLRKRGHDSVLLPSGTPETPSLFGTTVYWPGIRGVADIVRIVRSSDLTHIHGLWTLPASVAGVAARRSDTPYVVSVHGALNRWALSRKAWRKKIYGRMLERRHLRRAAAVHVVTRDEERAVQNWGVSPPIFLLRNAVDLSQFDQLPHRPELDARYPEARGRVVVLYLGRLAEEKGVDLLLLAFAGARPAEENLHLFLAGPGPQAMVDHLEVSARALSIRDQVTFTGEVRDDAKRRLFGGADMFVQLSHSEGDSVALKEAMGSGLPLIVSEGAASWRIQDSGAVVVTEREPGEVSDAIILLARDAERRRYMGRLGRDWAREHFSHVGVLDGLVAVYEDILRGTRTASHWCATESVEGPCGDE